MIQDIAPHIYHNEYKPSAPDKDSFILTYEKWQNSSSPTESRRGNHISTFPGIRGTAR